MGIQEMRIYDHLVVIPFEENEASMFITEIDSKDTILLGREAELTMTEEATCIPDPLKAHIWEDTKAIRTSSTEAIIDHDRPVGEVRIQAVYEAVEEDAEEVLYKGDTSNVRLPWRVGRKPNCFCMSSKYCICPLRLMT
jgi:hypothetical protein